MSAVELEDDTSNPASLSPSPMDSLLGPTASSPPDVLSPVGSPPSDDDRDRCGGVGDHDQAAAVSGTDSLTEDLKRRIIKQVEYYFSDENLPTDKHMISLIKKNKEGFDVEGDESKQVLLRGLIARMVSWCNHIWLCRPSEAVLFPMAIQPLPTDSISMHCVDYSFFLLFSSPPLTTLIPHFAVPISVIGSFRKMKRLIRDNAVLASTLRDSSFLVVSSDGKKVKRLNPFPLLAVRDSKLFTVLVENLPEDHSMTNICRIFGEPGNIKSVSIRDPHTTIETSKGDKGDKFINSNKLHALVEYETIEAAEKAVATLNNEQDWRNGLRVKLFKNMVQRGQKKQAWRDPSDSEKNHVNRLPEQLGEEGNDNSSEHHDETHDEENGTHSHKEKNEQRSRNRGRSGRQKHHGGSNGMGHGTTRSSHPHEPPKPPPGPRMPDGTKGFTMGRGRVIGSL